MNAERLFLVLLVGALLSACDQKGPPGLTDAREDIQEIKQMIKDVSHYLTGERGENPCVVGVPQTEECFYVVTIVKEINKDKLYQVQTSRRACIQNKNSGNPLLDCDKFHPAPRWITVFGDPPLKEKNDYDLFGQVTNPPTSQLACHDKNNKVTKDCVARTTDLPVITALKSR